MGRPVMRLMLVLGLCLGAVQAVGASEKPGYLGIGFEVDSSSGLLAVAHVVPGSPAEVAGIRRSDVLTAIAGAEVRFASHREALESVGRKVKEGVPIELGFRREGRNRSVVVVPAGSPPGLAARNEAALRCADSALRVGRIARRGPPQ